MTLKQDADKIYNAAVEAQKIDSRGGTSTGDWEEITDLHLESANRCGFIRGFRSGAAFSEARIIEMLRSEEAMDYYDSQSTSAPYNGADPRDMADWLESRLKDE